MNNIELKAPIAGVITELFVQVGDQVTNGQKVAIIEIMKMENELNVATAGTVSEIRVKENDIVNEGQIILTIQES